MRETVLVTGGAGYIGSVLTETLLDEGYKVFVLDNLLHGEQSLFHLCANPHFEFVYGDAADDATLNKCLRKVDSIIPLAAIVGASACARSPLFATEINLEAIVRLMKIRSSHQFVVYPTTNSGYGTKSGSVYCTEETPLEPISLYGRLKSEAESEVLSSGNSLTLRLATVFGMSPRMRTDLLVNDFVHIAMTNKYIVIFEKDFKRNYIHIRDVADCFVHCLRNRSHMVGKPYNLGLDEANLSKEELALKIKEHIPDFYVHFSEIGSDPDKRNYIVSNKRLASAGFTARRSLDVGIMELIKGYRMLGRGKYKNA